MQGISRDGHLCCRLFLGSWTLLPGRIVFAFSFPFITVPYSGYRYRYQFLRLLPARIPRTHYFAYASVDGEPAPNTMIRSTSYPVLRIRDVYPGARIPDRTFFHPGSELSPSRIRIKEFKYFNPKKWFLNSGLFIPDPGSRIQGSKRHRIRDHDPQHCFDADLGFFIKLGWYGKILIRAGHVFHCLI